MTLAEIIYQRSLRLPESAAREALDFIEFLERRYGVDSSSGAVEMSQVQREALGRLSAVRLPFGGKPIADRDQLHDDARG